MPTVEHLTDWLNDLATQAVATLPEKDSAGFANYVAAALAKDAQVERYQRKGFGESHPMAGRYGVSRMVKPLAVPVPRLSRELVVKIAATKDEWEGAFELVARNYKAAGYEGSLQCKVRFTPYHALPGSVTFIAKHGERVLMTMSLVPDNRLLGLPLDVLYEKEVRVLRRQRRRLAEVISLAADDALEMREFRQVFVALIRLMKQYHVTHGGDTWVITVNPRHSTYYTKALGYIQLGPCREYPAVQGHPAIAYWTDPGLIQAHSPKMHAEIFGKDQWAPGGALIAPRMPINLIRFLSEDTTDAAREAMPPSLFDYDQYFMNPWRW